VAEGGYTTAQVKEVPGLENVKTMGADGQFTADFVKAAGAASEGHYLSSPDFTSFGTGYQELVDKIKAEFGHDPLSIYHAHAYDAASMLFAAIEKVSVEGTDGTLYIPKGALRDALFATKDFQGLTGTLTCTATGDCGAPVMAVYQITAREVGGEWPPVEPVWRQ
jgi:branched-chain amino acid transport system substrate-binding protein